VKRAALVALGLVLILLAAGAALLALDVHRWHGTMASDDLRYRVTPASGDLWSVSAIFPWNAARDLLGLQDDLAYRDAVGAFWRGRPRLPAYGQPRLIAYRAEAQGRLNDIADRDRNDRRASEAENLFGVLAFVNAARDDALRASFLANGVASFQNAIALDPTNENAKYNLELALSRLADEGVAGQQTRGGGEKGGQSGAGAGEAGSGY
jgi:hypothetical protein